MEGPEPRLPLPPQAPLVVPPLPLEDSKDPPPMMLPPTIPLSKLPFCAIAGALTNTSPAIPAKVVIGDRVIVCPPPLWESHL